MPVFSVLFLLSNLFVYLVVQLLHHPLRLKELHYLHLLAHFEDTLLRLNFLSIPLSALCSFHNSLVLFAYIGT